MSYINYNGSIIEDSQPVLSSRNRSFRYGDGVFETIRLMNGEILFFEKHHARLKRSMEILQMQFSSGFSFQNLYLLIRHLDQVNNLKGNGRVRLQVFRDDGGYYTPEKNNASFLIEAEPMAETNYSLNANGLKAEFYQEITKPVNKLSILKSSNSLLYIMAGLFREKNGFDEAILLNSSGAVCEGVASNIFMISKGEVYTPSSEQGCIPGVMREQVMELLRTHNKIVKEIKISIQDLLLADEVFLTNVIDGLRWIGAIRNKRYFNTFSHWLGKEINEAYTIE